MTTALDVPKTLTGDEAVISRIVKALLWNAIGFTEKGTIDIKSDWTSDGRWLITVEDSGSGIPNSDITHIFEPFWRGEQRPQTPTAGAGLGLPMARALARLMSGDITLKESRVGKSVFCVQLQLRQPLETSTTN